MPRTCSTSYNTRLPLEQLEQHAPSIAKSYSEKGPGGFTRGLWATDLKNDNKVKKTPDELHLFQRFLHQCHFVQMTF